MTERGIDVGAGMMISRERGIDVGTGLSVISQETWTTHLNLLKLGVDTSNPEDAMDFVNAQKEIKAGFDRVGIKNFRSLREGHREGKLNEDQEKFWEEVTDAVALSVYLGYGDDEEFFEEVDRAKESGDYTNLKKNYFDVAEMDGVEELIAAYVPASEDLRDIMEDVSVLIKSGGLNESILNSVIGQVMATKVKRHDRGAKTMLTGYLGEIIAGMEGRGGRGVAPVDLTGTDSYRPTRFGSADGFERSRDVLPAGLSNIEGLVEGNRIATESWIVDRVVEMMENPLYFANWWQGTYADMLVETVRRVKGLDRREAGEIRDFTRAIVAAVGMASADLNVDDTAVTLVQFNPPKNMAREMMWSKDKFELLKEHPVMGFFMREIFNLAFEKSDEDIGQGWRIVKALSSLDENRHSVDDFADWMLERISGQDRWSAIVDTTGISRESAHSFCVVALEQFEVDFMPEWIRWCHKNKMSSVADRERQLEWFDYDVGNLGETTWDASMKAIGDDGEMYKVPYNHPRVQRPADLLLIKGSYLHNPGLVANFHRVMDAMIARRFYIQEGKEKGRMIPCRGSGQLDKYKKFAAFLEAVEGKGVQGQDIDDLTQFGEVVRLAVNYWGNDKHDELRDILADLFAVKVDAIFWRGYQSGARDVLLNLMRLDPTHSDERERKAAIEGLFGGSLRGNYGIFADAQRLWEMDFFGENGSDIARNALVRVITNEPDVEKAWRTFKRGGNVLLYKLFTTGAEGVAEVGKSLGIK